MVLKEVTKENWQSRKSSEPDRSFLVKTTYGKKEYRNCFLYSYSDLCNSEEFLGEQWKTKDGQWGWQNRNPMPVMFVNTVLLDAPHSLFTYYLEELSHNSRVD